jgi:ketosteroid isomerase-like protein
MTRAEILELAATFMAAVQAGDIETLKTMYAEDVTLWHTYDRADQNAADSFRTLAWMKKHVVGVRYEDLRVAALDDGFVQQHVMRGDAPKVDIPCMFRAWCVDGRITRIEEYLDSAHSAPIVEHIAHVREQRRLHSRQ